MANNTKSRASHDCRGREHTETTPHLAGSGTRNLRARSAGSRLSLTGRITESGTFSVTITQTRTKTVTIEVGPRKSLGDMNVLEVRHHAYIP